MIPLPERDPESPPQALAITPGFAVLLSLLLAFFQVVFMLMLHGLGFAAGPGTWGIAVLLAFAFSFMLAVPRIASPPGFHLGFVRPAPLAWGAALFLLSSILLISEADNILKQIWPLPPELSSHEPPGSVAYQLGLVLVLLVVLPGTQELLFRGVLQPPMVQQFGAVRGILYVSALNALALALMNPWAVASAFTTALVMGVVRHSGHSLLPSLLLHALFGVITLMATYQAFDIPGFDDTSAAHTPMMWLAPAAVLSGIGFSLCRAAAAATPPEPPASSEAPED